MSTASHISASGYDAEPRADKIMIEFAERKLAVFARNCRLLAERVAIGQLRLVDAADMLQSAAELSGLSDIVGADVVQRIMADAFTARVGCHVP